MYTLYHSEVMGMYLYDRQTSSSPELDFDYPPFYRQCHLICSSAIKVKIITERKGSNLWNAQKLIRNKRKAKLEKIIENVFQANHPWTNSWDRNIKPIYKAHQLAFWYRVVCVEHIFEELNKTTIYFSFLHFSICASSCVSSLSYLLFWFLSYFSNSFLSILYFIL